MIELVDVKKSFRKVELLRGVSFAVQRGERLSLLGLGGCGKTTILKIILGLLRPDSGSVSLLDRDIQGASSSEREELMRQVGMAFQQGALFDFMTVKQNLIFAMENMTNLNQKEMNERAETLLAGVKLSRARDQYPHELSGGMRRRVGIARALCTHPTVAVFDEPTSGLDPVTSTIILNMISDITKDRSDATLVVATNNVEIAIRFANRIVIIHEGKTLVDGLWRDLLVNSTEWVRNFLSVRLIGLDIQYAKHLDLPQSFIDQHWAKN